MTEQRTAAAQETRPLGDKLFGQGYPAGIYAHLFSIENRLLQVVTSLTVSPIARTNTACRSAWWRAGTSVPGEKIVYRGLRRSGA